MTRRKGESIFSYSLTHPYPFAWFTYVVFIGGVIFTVLFSFVALATNGYNLDIKYALDLNGTLDAGYWFQAAPFSWFSQTEVSCQPALLTRGSEYFTSNRGFTYSLDGIEMESLSEVEQRALPAIGYMNTPLMDCKVIHVGIEFQRRDYTRIHGQWWSWSMTYAMATANCAFETPSGRVKANLTTTLPRLRQGQAGDASAGSMIASAILSTNITEHPNIWFGSQLMYLWYEQLSIAMGFDAPTDGVSSWDSGTVDLYRNPDVDDYTQLTFFNCSPIFLANYGNIVWMPWWNTIADWADPKQNGPTGDGGGYGLPNISITVDTFAKVFYSLVLSDFGVADETNALSTWAGVKWLQSQVDKDLASNSDSQYPGNPVYTYYESDPFYPTNEAYRSVVDGLEQPPDLNSTSPPTIFAQYLCSIPKRKGGGALFFAVLIADLVFLQALWTLLNFAATAWLQRRYKEVNHCDGCRSRDSLVTERKRGSGGTAYERVDGNLKGSPKVTVRGR